ncbi:MAG: alpha/beta fold hydrolase [bacterium]|nr:alpha/beta fold hydrolase [bacterium]
MEAFDFIPVEGENLFSIIYRPARRLNGAGVIMIHPVCEEKLWVGRASTNLARALCDAGVPVLRFDLRGYGDSDRAHHDMNLSTAAADIRAAAEHFRTSENLTDLHLFGFRFGGTLALRHAADVAAASVAVINPLASGGAYLKKALRSNLTTQMSIFGEVREDRETLLAKMEDSGLLNIDGYHLSREFYTDCSQIDLSKKPVDWRGPGLVLSLVRSEGAAADGDSRRVFEACLASDPASRLTTLPYSPIWSEQKIFATGCPQLFDPIVDWFTNSAPSPGSEVG